MKRERKLGGSFHGGEHQMKSRGSKKPVLFPLMILFMLMVGGGVLLSQGLTNEMAQAQTTVVLYQTTIDLYDADITLNGIEWADETGTRIIAGDVNADLHDDIIIGARYANPGGLSNAGQVYVVFSPPALSGPHNLVTDADITINGTSDDDTLGQSIAVGDINGDGYGDIVMGARNADPAGLLNAGQTYVVLGSPAFAGVQTTIDLSTDADITIDGINSNDHSGYSVATGDINGDGIADIITSAPYVTSNKGQTYVVFGSTGFSLGTFPILDLATDADITINGIFNGDWSGFSVSVGDINGDGIDDIIIGASEANPGGRVRAGQTYVIFGSPALSGTINLSTGANVTINGIMSDDLSGSSSNAGDINGDGFDDIIIGARGADPGGRIDAGQTYVVFGSSTISGTINLSTGANITLNGIMSNDRAGWSVASGDVNGDGFDDIITGTPWASPGGKSFVGQTFVVYGSSTLSGTIEFSTDANITLNGINLWDRSGYSVGSGDVHDDGLDDILIGARNADANGVFNSGQGYVVYGFAPTPVPMVTVSAVPDSTVVPRGGVLSYQLTITNDTDTSQSFQFWSNVTLPNGNKAPKTGELIGPTLVTLGPHSSKISHPSHTLSNKAALGTYTYHAYVGPYPGVTDQSDFTFQVVTP